MRWDGPFEFDGYLRAVERVDEVVREGGVHFAIVDARGMTDPPDDHAELHRIGAALRPRVTQGGSFRTGIVATGPAADFYTAFLEMRDMVSLARAHDRPTARIFADHDEAVAWASAG